MKKLQYIIFVFLFSTVSCEAQEAAQCKIIAALLDIEQLNTDLKLNSKPIGYIRILDQSEMFNNCNCNYKKFSIGTIKDIPLDFNTGRYIDLAILKAQKDNSVITLEIFYALSGQNDTPNLFTGDIKLMETTEGIEIEKANIGNIQ